MHFHRRPCELFCNAPKGTQHKTREASGRSGTIMTSIYRTSPSKRSKSVGAGTGGGGGGGAGSWTVVGDHNTGSPKWVCPRHKTCGGHILARTRNGSSSQYGVCDTRRPDIPETCQTFFNINRKHWGSGENPVCASGVGGTQADLPRSGCSTMAWTAPQIVSRTFYVLACVFEQSVQPQQCMLRAVREWSAQTITCLPGVMFALLVRVRY